MSSVQPTEQSLSFPQPSDPQLSELLTFLQQIRDQTLPSLQAKLTLQDLESFITTLETMVQRYPYTPLIQYTDKLSNQLEDFDWSQIPNTVAEFHPLVETLQHQIRS